MRYARVVNVNAVHTGSFFFVLEKPDANVQLAALTTG